MYVSGAAKGWVLFQIWTAETAETIKKIGTVDGGLLGCDP
jgi:hypothetical protein